jgi:hypothetical protein
MSQYFRNFPKTAYRFGDNEGDVLFDDITAYVDIIDSMKDNSAVYEKYNIMENERPDVLSFKLYGTPNYHWTFFFMNDHIRESGWPVSNIEVFTQAQEYYPNVTLTTEDNVGIIFLEGTTVLGKTSGTKGIVLRRRLDLGQVIVQVVPGFGTGTFLAGEQVEEELTPTNVFTVYSQADQHNSIHHYENSDGEWVDIDPENQSGGASLVAVTYLERLQAKNDELKSIIVLKEEVVSEVVGEFKRQIGDD